MLGVVDQPADHAVRRGDARGGRGDGRGRHVPADPGRRVLRRADRRRGRRPVLRRRRTRPQPAASQCGECMTGCRTAPRTRSSKNYLYLAEQAGAEVHPLTTVTRVAPAAGRRLRRRHRPHRRRGPQARGARSPPTRSCSPPATLRHPAAAAPDARRGAPAATCPPRLGELTRTNSEAILGAPRRSDAPSTSPRASPSRRRSTPTSTPTSSRCATARAATRWACCRPRWPTAAARGRRAGCTWLRALWPADAACATCTTCGDWSEQTIIALVMQTRDNSITWFTKRGPARPVGAHLEAGPRRAQPDLDPGRQRRRAPHRRRDQRLPRRQRRRRLQHPDDRPLPRRLRRSATRPRPA